MTFRLSFAGKWMVGVACAAVMLVSFCPAKVRGAEFRSVWPKDITRTWVGPEYWANRLQDWRIAGGRLECVNSGADRNVHLLTRRLGKAKGDLSASVRLGWLGDAKGRPGPGWAGFRLGAKGRLAESPDLADYRDDAIRGRGLEAGLTSGGELFIGAAQMPDPMPVQRGIPRAGWKVKFVDSEETEGENARAANAFDGRPGTIWHTQYKSKKAPYPHEIQIDLGKSFDICGVAYLPRQQPAVGRIKDYDLYVSADGKDWGKPVAAGAFLDTPDLQEARFKETPGQYVRLVAKSDFLGRPACAIAELYVLDRASPAAEAAPAKKPPAEAPRPAGAVPIADVELRLKAEPAGESYTLTLSAHDPKTGDKLAEVTRQRVPPEQLVGSLALVCDAQVGGARRRPGVQAAGGNARFWFSDWCVGGAKVEAHDGRAFGPILWAQYTLSNRVLRITAQMPPLSDRESQTVRLETHDEGDKGWKPVGQAQIDKIAPVATIRVADWDSTRDTPYRLVYAMAGPDGQARDCYWTGTIRHDPVEKETVVVAAFTGNADPAFPNVDLVRDVQAQDPDVLFFSGDNIYENVGGYGTQRSPLDQARLDYLRKWYLFGWAYGGLMRDRPCVSIPDDHDVYQGNLWGAGGRHTDKDDRGGYVMPAEWVKLVERTQTGNLPDPYDPTPIEQGIGVYYCPMTYGRISFAVLEDRKFKSGPSGLVPPTTSGRADWVTDPSFDPKTADVPGAKLLGDRQLKFVRDWAADWRGADMKVALSQTVFAGAATHHGGNLKYLVVDYDSNGWPQTGRNKALRELRKGFAFMIGGDQHLATIIHHGVDDWNDGGWSFAVPSIANFYLRAWMPKQPGRNRVQGSPEYTGEFLDGLGNHITVRAATNPGESMGHEPAWLHDKKPGYGIVRFDKKTRKITIECWPRFADPKDPKAKQYAGWPKTIDQLDNYSRKAVAFLPTIQVKGLADPVVQVIDEADSTVVYTIRIAGTTFRPKVFKQGKYTVKIGEEGTERMKTFKGVPSLGADEAKTLDVEF